MTLFTIEAELLDFGKMVSFGFEIGTWYILISFWHWSIDLTLKVKPEYRPYQP